MDTISMKLALFNAEDVKRTAKKVGASIGVFGLEVAGSVAGGYEIIYGVTGAVYLVASETCGRVRKAALESANELNEYRRSL